mmetsp:Transcript_95183/g.139004  ORF Transcript_95183/g.139004 Transcript_95183/m.139004 type:complete len:335 (+) Transcript_95183:131-1135(+)
MESVDSLFECIFKFETRSIRSDEVKVFVHSVDARLRDLQCRLFRLCRDEEIVDNMLVVTKTPVFFFANLFGSNLIHRLESRSENLFGSGGGGAVALFCEGKHYALQLGSGFGVEAFLAFSQHGHVQHWQAPQVLEKENVEQSWGIRRALFDKTLERGTHSLHDERQGEVCRDHFARDANGIEHDEAGIAEPDDGEGHDLGVNGIEQIERVADQLGNAPGDESHCDHLLVTLLCALWARLQRELAALGLRKGCEGILVEGVMCAPHNCHAREHLDEGARYGAADESEGGVRDFKHSSALHDLHGPLVLIPQTLQPPLGGHRDHREEDKAPSAQAK